MEPEVSLPFSRGPSLSWVWTVQSIPPHPIYPRSILILSLSLCLGLSVGLFPSGFPTNKLYTFILPHLCYTPCPSHPRLGHSTYSWQSVQIMKLLHMQFPPPSYHFILLCSKYSHQHCSHTHSEPQTKLVLYIQIFIFLKRRQEDKRF
jgi:hypothetical protein